MTDTPAPPAPARPSRKFKSFDDDDIVRYSMTLDVPIVGLVRNRNEYKEMREIALIYGTTLGIAGKAEAPREEKQKPRAEPEVA